MTGSFYLPTAAGRISVFAAHEQGFVEVPLEDVVKSGAHSIEALGSHRREHCVRPIV